MFIVLFTSSLLFLWFAELDVCPQYAHLLVEIVDIVELILLSQSQLTVIVIQTLFGYPYYFSSLLQTKPFSHDPLLMQMQVPPFFYQGYHLPYRPLLISAVFLLSATVTTRILQILGL